MRFQHRKRFGMLWTVSPNGFLSPSFFFSFFSSADERLAENRNALCIINNRGEVTWIPQAVFKSSCDINVKAFPFDVQTCFLKFGSWAYDGSKVDLLFKNGLQEANMSLSDYQESNVWDILDVKAKRNVEVYDCCPDEPFVDLNFSLIIRRKATFYSYTLILPCVLLTSLTLVLFWIPPESPAKMTLGKYNWRLLLNSSNIN